MPWKCRRSSKHFFLVYAFRLAHSLKLVNAVRFQVMAISPATRPLSSLHLRDTTVIITGGIIADHTGVTE